MIMADQKKKQIPLRLSAKLYDAVAAWAEDDFRSVNGQIEYLLTECVRQRKKNGKYVSEHLDEHPEFDIKYEIRLQYSFFQQWSLKSKTAEEELSKVLFYDILINEKKNSSAANGSCHI